jgi:peptide/nickel transport system substrate-binding protein
LRDYEWHLIEEVRAGRLTRRELVRRGTIVGLSLPAIGALLAACGGDSGSGTGTTSAGGGTGAARQGGNVNLAVTAPGADVDPITMFNSGGVAFAQIAGEYLCVPDRENNLVPVLATKWEPGATPDEWTFTIRQGVKWQDGSDLTADDVVGTFDRITDPEGNASALSALTGILSKGSTEATDTHTVVFHLDRPFADFPYIVSSYTYGSVILPKNYTIGDYAKGGVGTGPFIVESFNPSTGCRARRNPNYWNKGRPYLDSIELKYYDEVAPQVLAMQSGEADVMVETPFQGAQPLYSDPNIALREFAASAYRELHMRVDTDPFKDKLVRQAIAYCVDREALVQTLWEGNAIVANDHGFAPHFPTAPGEGEIEQRTQDYDRAKQLLADAGFANGIDVTLSAENFLEIPQYVQFLKEQCKGANVNVELNLMPLDAYYGSGDNQPWLEVPMGCVDWAARGTASQLIGPAYTCDGVWNSAHWCNEDFDAAMASLDSEVDLQKRKEHALRAAQIQHDEVPAIIAYWITQLRAVRSTIVGLPGQFLDVANMGLKA